MIVGRQRQGASSEADYWGRRPRDWANVQEGMALPLYREVFDRLDVGPGTRLLDVGCASGIALALGARRGADPVGLDLTPGFVGLARARVPRAYVHTGDLAALPFADGEFDVVTGFNSFQYADDITVALREAKRVCANGGHVAIAVWGAPQETEASAYLYALGTLMPAHPTGAARPFAVSAQGAVADLATGAGLLPVGGGSVACPWDYPDLETALRGLLSSGPAARAIDHSGEQLVRSVVAEAIAPFRRPSGRYLMQNRFRFLIAAVDQREPEGQRGSGEFQSPGITRGTWSADPG